ncbi:aldo/keto reductase [Peribacillus frigoritolerans]|jgi:diketogulonate reductase-like aldo/keto reductase|uniref:aldo/keto reductase n=1 Tax=Peribacillus TaxID=2675229 RepID=UPI001D56ADD2|nr:MULTISPECIES: aldo/keto reductase [Peribacillus]MCY9004060.1 aldo/keto reductase [Peribacillus frigoritolerans]MCZ0871816.1 aldo/keto reductase [Peribacillus sp. AS_2]MED3892103.1 aldo/keto reductase [Peribacillus frigoritolerans]MED3994116.1 aldo/keto reductase [Peribacillus frigoritolerans]MED4631699.1 aldo/keto reductase [Peribacillus frigoritolerans]
MISNIGETITLHNGVKMPQLGFGVFKVKNGNETVESVKKAVEVGYRAIDTAAIYENEEGVGQAIRECGVPREELFITSKVWNTEQGYDTTLKAFEDSLNRLGLEYLDLYLIHWPGKDKYLETWRALEKLYKDGKVKSIGVSNFHIHHLENLLANSEVKPVVNQIELHPLLTQVEIRDYCAKHEIKVESWSPLGRGNLLEEPTINHIAKKHGKSPAQVLIRWHLQHDLVVIPKSITPSRIKENAQVFDFSLSLNEMNQIDALNKNERFGSNPDELLF